jgi:uncharacterized protein YdaU (DUF1376 family)
MNYYPHHIGDFNSATRHLSRTERSIYRDMIEMYYDTEQPLPLDRAALCRKLMARSDEESTAVEQVLSEFFTETEQGWANGRCDKEIEAYHKKLNDKSAAGKASAAARAANKAPLEPASNKESSTGVQQVLTYCSTNQEPRTSNQQPVTKNQERKEKAAQPAVALPEWLPLLNWNAYLEMRKEKKKIPTARAVELVLAELLKLMQSGQDIAAVLDKSTRNGWTDVYAIKPDQVRGVGSVVTDIDAINARNNAEAKRLLGIHDDGIRTING